MSLRQTTSHRPRVSRRSARGFRRRLAAVDGAEARQRLARRRASSRSSRPSGPKVVWRTPIAGGYAGPAVAGGKVYVIDRVLAKGAANPDDPFDTKEKINSTERVLCLDAKTGKEIWKHEYDCPYQISYPAGPRCTPLVHDGKVYTLGAMGNLFCFEAGLGQDRLGEGPQEGVQDQAARSGATRRTRSSTARSSSRSPAATAATSSRSTRTPARRSGRPGTQPEQGYSPVLITEAGGKRQMIVAGHEVDLLASTPRPASNTGRRRSRSTTAASS